MCSYDFFKLFVNLWEAVDLCQAELGDVDLHWVNDGEAAVPVLLGDHHRVSALWWLGDHITGCRGHVTKNLPQWAKQTTSVWTYKFNKLCLFSSAAVPTLVAGMAAASSWAVLPPQVHRLDSCSVSRGGWTLGLYHTHGKDWCASWWSGWNCCRGCGCGKRPWPRSARSGRSPSESRSHSSPRSAHTEAEGDPGSWGTSLLSSPSHQTPSRYRKKDVIQLEAGL